MFLAPAAVNLKGAAGDCKANANESKIEQSSLHRDGCSIQLLASARYVRIADCTSITAAANKSIA